MPKIRLSKQEIIKRVNEWQRTEHVHPLTCGRDSSHPLLRPRLTDNRVVLVCPECAYFQLHIPEVVLRGVPPLPTFGFSKKSLRGVVRDIEKLGKGGRKMAKEAVTVVISKKGWQALLRGDIGFLEVVFPGKVGTLMARFGMSQASQEKNSMKVRITPV